jgi:hypothetical protein
MRIKTIGPGTPRRLFPVMLQSTLLATALMGMQAMAQLPPAQQQGNIEYLSGGIGLDESTAFKTAMSQYPLALTFAASGGNTAAYVADVQVVIRDSHDNDVLNTKSKGPYFLVRLPPGQYQVFATYDNKTQSKKATVESSGTRRLMFDWKRPESSEPAK